jgi:transposase
MSGLTLTSWQRRRLQRQLHQTQDAHLYRRTLAVLEFARGKPPAVIAAALGVSRQSIYNWVGAYTAAHDPADLTDGPRPGRPTFWTEETESLLRALLGHAPDQLGYPAVNWTVPLLREALQDGTGHWVSDDTIRRALDRLGYTWKRPRYVLDPDPELEKKTAYPGANPGLAAPQRCAG